MLVSTFKLVGMAEHVTVSICSRKMGTLTTALIAHGKIELLVPCKTAMMLAALPFGLKELTQQVLAQILWKLSSQLTVCQNELDFHTQRELANEPNRRTTRYY
mgnify:CR=1 FL=1